MAISSDTILSRLKSLVPSGWFSDTAPIRDAILGGIADGLVNSSDLLFAAQSGTRRAGTEGWLLDLDAWGFFGANLLRFPGESDDVFRARYINEIFRERCTRNALTSALIELTGRAPTIIEPWNTGDCGGWDTGALAWSGEQVLAGPISAFDSPYGGWDAGLWGFDLRATQSQAGFKGAGCWGSLEMPNQVLLTAHRLTPTDGTPNIGGWDSTAGAWDRGTLAWTGDIDASLVVDDEIYAVINRTKAAGVTVWTSIQN